MRRLILLVVLALGAPAAADPTAPAPMTERQTKEEDTTWRGPSGFWTNPRPAKGGAYRWRMMAIGGVLLLFTGYAVLRLLKKANADRASRK